MPHHPDPTTLAHHAQQTAHRLLTNGDTATRYAQLAEAGIGYTRPNLNASVAGGDRTSVVERAAASHERATATAWWNALDRLTRALTELEHAMNALLPKTPTPHDTPPVGAGHCGCCTRWVSGSTTDRLRSGLCDACRQAVRRITQNDPTIDRGAAIARRRRTLTETTTDTPTP
jgi:hypothetical protein